MSFSVDETGVWVPRRSRGAFDVYFDGQHAWSFRPDAAEVLDGRPVVRWPRAMLQWLDGSTEVRITKGDKEVHRAEVSFGAGSGRVSMIDAQGIPVMVDKWGLVQRPFSGRHPGVVKQMTDLTQQIVDVLAAELDLHVWLAFGSLLGAARSGKVIGHDSDVDLSYLSHADSMVGCIREMYEITRVLRAAGLTVMNKSGGFVTVLFTGDDGGQGSIDIYSFFYVGENLYGNATLRVPADASIIEPLGLMEFEGVMLPVPADPDAMLTLSYGPNWRVPDPSFSHSPSAATNVRFDGWMGSLMDDRREWERWVRLEQPQVGRGGPSPFGHWALAGLAPGSSILDLGAGTGRDVVAAGRRGHRALGLDYARGAFLRARRIVARDDLDVSFGQINFYSWRDTVTAVALAVHRKAPTVVFAGGVLDSVGPQSRQHVYRALQLALGGRGGEARLEFAHDLSDWEWVPNTGGVRYPVAPEEVASELARLGGKVTSTERVRASNETLGMALTRMKVRWEATG